MNKLVVLFAGVAAAAGFVAKQAPVGRPSEAFANAASESPAALESRPAGETAYPLIKGHGRIVRLPDAAAQPRDGSKICVDVTAGGEPDRINPAVEKLARFQNIYAGAGRKPATCRMTVVLHGKATLVALNDAAYRKRFRTASNPNLPLIRTLEKHGVEFLVCGQSLHSKGGKPSEVAREIDLAVSGLTANVNRQRQGYAYIPLH